MVKQLVVVWLAFVMAWYALNVPADQLEITQSISRGQVSEQKVRATRRIGGFPWKYCEFAPDQMLDHRRGNFRYYFWSTSNLVWNISVGVAMLGILGLIVLRGSRRRSRLPSGTGEPEKQRSLQISIAGLLGVITVLTVLLGLYRYGNQRLANGMKSFDKCGGRATAKITAPHWLASVVNVAFLMPVERGSIQCKDCPADAFRRITMMRSLRSLSVTGATAEQICRLAALPKLETINLQECVVDEAVCEALAANPTIRRLHFQTQQMPPKRILQKLFGGLANRNGYHQLTASPRDGETIVLDVIPGLSALTVGSTPQAYAAQVQRYDSKRPKATSTLLLENVPDLEQLSLGIPLTSLEIENAPKLERLSVRTGVEQRLKLKDMTKLLSLNLGPLLPRELELENLPALREQKRDRQTTNRYMGGLQQQGITIEGTLTAPLAESLGEYLSAVTLPREFTVPGLAMLLTHQPLKILDISGSRIKPTVVRAFDFDSLPEFPRLQSFRASEQAWPGDESNFTREVYQLLKKTPNLRELRVGARFHDDDMPLLAPMTQLEILDTSASQVTDKGWKQCPEMPSLKYLSIPKGLTKLELKDLPRLRRVETFLASLQSLRLKNLPAFEAGIDGKETLQHLDIDNVPLQYLFFRKVPREIQVRNSTVRGLYADGTAISDQQFADLVRPGIEVISVSRTDITSAALNVLLGMKELKVLDISGTSMTETDVQRLLNGLNLEHLEAKHIPFSKLTREALPRLDPRQRRMRGLVMASRSFPILEDLTNEGNVEPERF